MGVVDLRTAGGAGGVVAVGAVGGIFGAFWLGLGVGLMRIAKKHRSQALEADALHFSTDIWSSAVVILGLVALYIASFLPEGSALRPWLERADAIAAPVLARTKDIVGMIRSR